MVLFFLSAMYRARNQTQRNQAGKGAYVCVGLAGSRHADFRKIKRALGRRSAVRNNRAKDEESGEANKEEHFDSACGALGADGVRQSNRRSALEMMATMCRLPRDTGKAGPPLSNLAGMSENYCRHDDPGFRMKTPATIMDRIATGYSDGQIGRWRPTLPVPV